MKRFLWIFDKTKKKKKIKKKIKKQNTNKKRSNKAFNSDKWKKTNVENFKQNTCVVV